MGTLMKYSIRLIQESDNAHVANVIRTVMREFGAVGEGYSIVDPEVDDMFGNYADETSCYYVVESGGVISGGAGIAPLQGGVVTTCELRKMFFLPELRGLGLGRQLITKLMGEARTRGFTTCYLETLERMERANSLYQKIGFKLLEGPLGNTGHCSCELWYAMKL